jgi:spoIIIJ-associated protein
MSTTEQSEAAGREAVERVAAAVVEGFGVEATVELSDGEEDAVVVEIGGEGATVLVARGAEVLDALQYLSAQVASRASGDRRKIIVDADGYRAKRAASLEELAQRAASEALDSGDEIELDPMSPQDRRTVHMALKDREDVVTRSEGNEPRRRIIVEPAD